MTAAPRQPLTGEERELADRLARLGAAAEPPSALDARILAAAHAAVARTPVRRNRRRWPVAFGAVATLALAVGIAWQLRPSQETHQVYSEAPPAARAIRSSGPSADQELPVAAMAEPAPAASVPPPESANEEAAADSAAPQDAEPARAAPAKPAPEERDASREQAEVAPAPAQVEPQAEPQAETSQDEEIIFDAHAPAMAPPPPPPAPAAAPAAASDAAAGAAANQRLRRESAAEAKSASDTAGDDTELDRISVTGSRIERDSAGFEDQAIDDQPPATADSPAVQRAWLQQIRELVAEGRTDAARESLAEFKRRYPRYALPDDLRAFAP